jgi:copper oxidase (laccase) domain-containing protein
VKAARRAVPRYSAVGGRTWLTYSELARPGFVHGIVVFRDLRPDIPFEQWTGAVRSYFDAATPIAGVPVVFGRQVHGSRVGRVRSGGAADEFPGGTCGGMPPSERRFVLEPAGAMQFDSLVTGERGVALAVTVSDCLPLFAAGVPVFGVAHCGWRGIASGVVQEFVGALGPGAAARALFVVGAGIGPCCYEVRDDMLAAFGPDAARYCSVRDGITSFDLRAAVTERLAASGISRDRILVDGTCTSCRREILSSYRAEAGDCGRMVAFLASR